MLELYAAFSNTAFYLPQCIVKGQRVEILTTIDGNKAFFLSWKLPLEYWIKRRHCSAQNTLAAAAVTTAWR